MNVQMLPNDGRHPRAKLVASRVLIVLGVLGVGALGLLFPFPWDGRIWAELFNLAHAPAFCIVLLVVVGVQDPAAVGLGNWFQPVRHVTISNLLFTALFLVILGVAGEIGQGLVGRSSSLGDVLANTLGLLAACFFVLAMKSPGSKRSAPLAASVLVLIASSWSPLATIVDSLIQRQQMPLLSSLERDREIEIWHGLNSRLERTSIWSTDGDHCLMVTLRRARFSGATLVWPIPDWSEYRQFSFDIRNPGRVSQQITLKIQDELHKRSGFDPDDRFQKSFTVPAESELHIAIRLDEVSSLKNDRVMDLSAIHRVEWFTGQPEENSILLIDNVRLED